jgi:transcriptional regulator with XRE-family HTH domain
MAGPELTPTDKAIGVRVRERRLALGMTQKASAAALDITAHQLRRYEIGLTRMSVATLVRIATGLKATVADLVGEIGNDVNDVISTAGLNSPGAQELLAAYAGIPEPELREYVLGIAKGLATAEDRRAWARLGGDAAEDEATPT